MYISSPVANGLQLRISLSNGLMTVPHERLCLAAQHRTQTLSVSPENDACPWNHFSLSLSLLVQPEEKKCLALCGNYLSAFLHSFTTYVYIFKQYIFSFWKKSMSGSIHFSLYIFHFTQHYFWSEAIFIVWIKQNM